MTTTDGYYEFAGIPYGTYTLEAAYQSYSTTKDFYYPHMPYQVNLTLSIPTSFPENTILIVVDDDGANHADEGAWPSEISEAATSLGLNVYMWASCNAERRPSISCRTRT